MAIWHLRSKKGITGKKLNQVRKKRKMDRGSVFLETRIDKRKTKVERARGGNRKTRAMAVENANVADQKTGKITRTKILTVKENPANPHYVRRNIVTRGAVIQTETGLARVTSSPGQSGIVNAVLVEEKK